MSTSTISQIFELKEELLASELGTIVNIDNILLNKIKNKIGNKCNELGYVEKESIELLSRNLGIINSSQFNGDVQYNIKLRANICLPVKGNILHAKVKGKNKIGVFAICESIQVIVAHAHHEANELDDISIDDDIKIEVINYKFKLNDICIKVIGKYIGK